MLKPHLSIENLNLQYTEIENSLSTDKTPVFKKLLASSFPKNKTKSTLFVINFSGDSNASSASSLEKEISAVIASYTTGDEVLLKLESSGGAVNAYGLATAQLQRLAKLKIPLTISVDRVAASGGYMMACIANKIIASPFAMIGSIGVAAEMPNFHKLLDKVNVTYTSLTAGENKRLITPYMDVTELAKKQTQDLIDHTHQLFKAHVSENRPLVDIDKVATGGTFWGTDAMDKKLIDEIQTSEDFLYSKSKTHRLLSISWKQSPPTNILKRALAASIDQVVQSVSSKINTPGILTKI